MKPQAACHPVAESATLGRSPFAPLLPVPGVARLVAVGIVPALSVGPWCAAPVLRTLFSRPSVNGAKLQPKSRPE